MNSEMTNKPLFKVKCIDVSGFLTLGKEYEVVEVEVGFYKIENDIGELQSYFKERFEIVDKSSKNKQKFYVGDKVVINKISDCFVSFRDKNIKVGDVATVTRVANEGNLNVLLENHNWVHGWWFSKSDLSLAEKLPDYHLLSHQEVVQAIIDEVCSLVNEWVMCYIAENETEYVSDGYNDRGEMLTNGKKRVEKLTLG